MSTRCSIIYDYENGIHVFEEMNSGEICFQFGDCAPINEKYGAPILNKQQLKYLFDYLEKQNARKAN